MCSVITRDQEKLKPDAVYLLLTLLSKAPLVNILVFVMTIEGDRDLAFAESRFTNAAFGIRS